MPNVKTINATLEKNNIFMNSTKQEKNKLDSSNNANPKVMKAPTILGPRNH
jgi:hypothetical protein